MSLTTAHSLWLAPLCLLLGIVAAWWLYRRAEGKEGFSGSLSLILAGCRALAIALIAFFLLEPMIRILVREVRKPVVVILHDGSSSVLAAGDATAIRTTYPAELARVRDALGDRFEVRSFTYGDAVAEGLDMDQIGSFTDIDQALREVNDRFSGPDLGAVIIDGDGIYNRGRDPRAAADQLGVPVFAIALGDTTVRPDLLLRAVDHNRIGYLGNELPLLVKVEGRRSGGAATRVSVLQAGKEVAGKDLVLSGRNAFVELPFTVKPERAGMQRYTVLVRPVEGEATEVNNRLDVLIDVLDDRQKVLLLGAAPHPDLGALRLALAGLEGYGTELAYADAFTGDVSGHDLIILHGLPSPKYPIQALLQKADAAGVPVCYILTSAMDFNAFNARNAGVSVAAARGSLTDAQANVNKNFSFFTLDPDQQRAMERYPPLQVPFGQFELGRSAMAMANQRIGMVNTAYPLIAFNQRHDGRAAVIAGEGIWRWRISDLQQSGDHARFDRFVHKLVQFLALKVNKERFRVEHAPRVNEHERVVFTAELYDATFAPVSDAEIGLVLKDEAGRDFSHAFVQSGSSYRADVGQLPAGGYTWSARTTMEGKSYSAAGEIHVEALTAEQMSTVADHGLWQDIAARTNGLVVKPGSTGALVQAIEARPGLVARSYVHPGSTDLIGLRWIFFAILALLTCEWVLRRRNGAY
ncbi:MAG: hypothetical protein KDB95_01615 [Flavobacteriales bacterium]|nr:hypothetical protein [Flavobacteriales bacterium]